MEKSNYQRHWPTPWRPVQWYREIMELMAPDVIVVPVVQVGPADNPEELCGELHKVAAEYAKRMEWGWRNVNRERIGDRSSKEIP